MDDGVHTHCPREAAVAAVGPDALAPFTHHHTSPDMKLIHPFLPISRAQLPPAKRREEIQAIQDDFKHTRQLSEKKVALSLVTYETVRTSVTLT